MLLKTWDFECSMVGREVRCEGWDGLRWRGCEKEEGVMAAKEKPVVGRENNERYINSEERTTIKKRIVQRK